MRWISIDPDKRNLFSCSGIMKTAIYQICLFCKPYQAASVGLFPANSINASADFASILFGKPISLLSYESRVA
jgi:hypothetical protein